MIIKRRSRGRPRQEGARHPGGQLVRKAEPNAKVMEIRRALAGPSACARLEAAESPMSLALARGWISPEQHRAGEVYAALWRRSHPQRRSAVSGMAAEERPEPSDRDPRAIREMTDAEIAQAFEAALMAGPEGPASEASQAEARSRYNAMSRAMTAGEQNEVFLCFCLSSWPQWVLQRCAGHFDTDWERKRRMLIGGLERLVGMNRPRRVELIPQGAKN